jgi:glycosyltransferase involved in cell wall biosynthesis
MLERSLHDWHWPLRDMTNFRILHTESSHGRGGQEYRVLSEAREMGIRGHQVVVAAPENSQLICLAQQEGIRCEAIPVGISGWGKLFPKFLSLIGKYQIQIVHTHGSQDSWLAASAGRFSSHRPVIVRTRHKSTPVSDSLRHALLYRCLPHAVTTTGEAVRKQLIEQNGLDPGRVFSIPTGVDMQRFLPCASNVACKQALGIQSGQLVVGTVSFLRPEKGMDVLIDAMYLLKKKCPQVCCLIVGAGQERQKLLEQIRQRQLEETVMLPGFREDIPELLGIMDVFVLPSLEEGMPQSLLQALAMERAVVASSVGGVPEVIQHGQTGLLVPPRDSVALAEQVEWLLRESAQGRAMGQAGRQVIVRRYSVESMLTKTEELYASLWEKRMEKVA